MDTWLQHDLEKTGKNKWRCTICGRQWRSRTKTFCPGVTYYATDPSDGIVFTRSGLAQQGYKLAPNQQPCGYGASSVSGYYFYYSIKESVPLKRKYKGWRISVAGLKELYWTDSAIRKFLGEPDELVENPHYKKAAPMRLYDVAKVEEAEDTPEFQQWLKKRMAKLKLPMPYDAVLGGVKEPLSPNDGDAVLGGKRK